MTDNHTAGKESADLCAPWRQDRHHLTTPQAEALAAKGEIILAVGSNSEIEPDIGPNSRVIDLRGQLAVPGLIDGTATI